MLDFRDLRDRIPAAFGAVLFHIAIVVVLLNAILKYAGRTAPTPEAIITLTPQKSAPPRIAQPAARGGTAPYRYNYVFNPAPTATQPNLQGLSLALSSCAPENMGTASEEVRAVCRRIGAVVAANPETFGMTPNFKNGVVWERELMTKQTPLLLPCASPYPPPPELGIVAINLGTLLCIADIVENGYHPDKMQHYSK